MKPESPTYDPELLRTFLAVAQSLSFTQAGDRLGIRQPTVSQHIRKLESAVGRALFVRDTRSVTLTADGEAMAGFARTILAAHEQASDRCVAVRTFASPKEADDCLFLVHT